MFRELCDSELPPCSGTAPVFPSGLGPRSPGPVGAQLTGAWGRGSKAELGALMQTRRHIPGGPALGSKGRPHGEGDT